MRPNNILIAAILSICFIAPASAQSALEWAAQGMGSTRIAHVDRAFMRRVAFAEGRMVLTSWYGGGERLNHHTASGEVFRPHGLTAAHRSLPLGTRLRVCYRGCVVVRVNDRGPSVRTGRSLDLARGAAAAIGLTRGDVTPYAGVWHGY